jgi:hypothetical protein
LAVPGTRESPEGVIRWQTKLERGVRLPPIDPTSQDGSLPRICLGPTRPAAAGLFGADATIRRLPEAGDPLGRGGDVLGSGW